MKDNNNIKQQLDSMFRDNLNNAQVPAPEGIWESIAQNISQTPLNPSFEIINSSSNGILSGISTLGKIALITTTAILSGIGMYYFVQETSKKIKSEAAIENTVVKTEFDPTNKNHEQGLTEKENYSANIVKEIQVEENSNSASLPPENTKTNNHNSNSKNNTIPEIYNLSTPNPISKKTQGEKQEPSSNISSVNVEKPIRTLTDTVLCFTTLFKPSWAFGQFKIANTQIVIDNKIITSFDTNSLNLIKNKWVVAKAILLNGEKVERRVKLSSSSIELSVTNAGENAAYCQILNGGLFTNTLWYINNQLIDEDVKHIVYYRNMEFAIGTAIDLRLIATDINGCIDSVSDNIRTHLDVLSEPVIPNVITPNNDGLNDKWEIEISGEVYFKSKVLGNNNIPLFQSTDKNIKWDGLDIMGNPVPAGSYIYVIEYQFPNQNIKTKTGYIQLIRN